MLIKADQTISEATSHGTPKRVILRGGVLPDVTQVAVATLTEADEVELHSHATMYENYFVLEGRALYIVGDETYEIGPGDFLVIPPGVPHQPKVTAGPLRVFYWGIATDAR
jgi:mannose-6-phosphate isomerase-like protein (cupin superfamily)